jgi:competence protein ComEC
MRLASQVAVVGLCLSSLTAYCAGKAKPPQIYMVDVEGGQATLVVSPSGQSLLIDAGWLGFDGGDAGRIPPRIRPIIASSEPPTAPKIRLLR